MSNNKTMPRLSESDKMAGSGFFEGIISIRAILSCASPKRRINKIFYAAERLCSNKKEFGWLKAMSATHTFEIEILPRAEIDSMAFGTTHGGIIASCSDREYPELTSEFIEKTRKKGFYAMIEGIEDPFNFGYAVRSIYAAGADAIILSKRNWMNAAGVVCKSSAGASELCEIAISDGADAAKIFRASGFRIICSDIKNSVSVYESDLSFPILLIIGGEKRGISRTLLNKADEIVRLDYGREFPEALSAASAAAILSYEVLRQNKAK